MGSKRWTASLIVLFVLFVYVLIRFAANTNNIEKAVESLKTTQKAKGKTAHFILIAQELDNPYWRKIEQGAKKAALTYNVQVEYIAPLQTSVEEQMKLFEKAIVSKVDGIVVQSLDEQIFAPIINKAVKEHIPVVTIDTDSPKSERVAYVGTDNYTAGEKLGEAVAEMTGGEGEIGVIIGSETSTSQKLRFNGFLSVVQKYPQMKVVEVKSSNISKIQAVLQAESMLKKHPDISIMVGMSALDAIGILNATTNMRRNNVQIFGFDDVEETLQAISNGHIQATIVQKPFDMGFQSIKILRQHLQGKAMKVEHFTPTEVITKNNIHLEETN